MPGWCADRALPRAFAWTPAWVVACVALWPLPGVAEAVLSLGALAVACLLCVAWLRERALPLSRPAFVLAAVVFAAYWLPQLVSAVDALDRDRAWKEVVADLRYLPFLWGVAIAAAHRRGLRTIAGAVALLVAAWSVDALLQAVSGTSPLFVALDVLQRFAGGDGLCAPQEASDRLGGVFGPCNPKLGLVLASLSPVALAVAWRWFGLAGWGVAALATGVVVVLAGARAAWVGYALVLAWAGWQVLGPRRLLAAAAIGMLMLAALYLGSPLVQQRVDRTILALQAGDGGQGLDQALSGRVRIWQGAVCMVRAHPVNGVGVRGFRSAWAACDPQPGQAPAWGQGQAHHAHQVVLEVLSETGAVGLLLWLAGALAVWRAWRRSGPAARERAGAPLLALAVTVFPFNTHLAFYSTFWGGLTLLLAGLAVGALHGCDAGHARAGGQEDAPLRS